MRASWMAALGVALVCVASSFTASGLARETSGTASAARGSSVVLSPLQGARVSRNVVRIVVLAGNEWNDVDARLNGVQLGREFGRAGRGRRVLDASASHGLRVGNNVLRVSARSGGTVRRATVRFRVVRVHRRRPLPLVGAGRDQRVPVGMAARIRGRIRFGSACHCKLRIRWSVVSAPVGSRFAKRPVRKGRSAAATPLAPLVSRLAPVRAVSVPLGTLGGATAPITSFRPDARGSYLVKLTASAKGLPAVSDQVTVVAPPRSPVATVDTAATSSDGIPGIQLVGTIYPAPPMGKLNDQRVWAGTTASGVNFHALWQILAVDRATLAVLSDGSGNPWNRTYGACSQGGRAWICRMGANNVPQPANAQQDLAALGQTAMVIAASQRFASGGPTSQFWGPPNQLQFATGALTEIGFPSDVATIAQQSNAATLLQNAPAGTASAIGVPGMTAGEANIDIYPNARAQMRGYLAADPNNHFSFMASARPQFDLHVQTQCASGSCNISQPGAQRTIANGVGGYLVTAFDGHTMAVQASQFFDTSDDPDGTQADALTNFLNTWGAADSLIMLTSVRTPGQGATLGAVPVIDPNAPVDAWARLARSVAAVGGTRDMFNRSAASLSASYALVGWGGDGEGSGSQTSSPTSGSVVARLRGALVPNRQSLYRPVDVSTTHAPAERLAQLIVRTPVSTWPLDNTPAHAALDYIGSQIPQLGDSPRQAYWTQSIDQSTATDLVGKVQAVPCPASACNGPGFSYHGQTFSGQDFLDAQQELEKELGWVGNVRDYLAQLAAPQTASGDAAFAAANTLQATLEEQLANADAKAQVEFSWVDLASGLLDLVGALAGYPDAGKTVQKVVQAAATAAALIEVSGSLANALWDGGSGASPQGRLVEADNLAEEIQNQASDAVNSYARMGDMIISDYSKLQEVGTYAECNSLAPTDACGANGQYDEYALPTAVQNANAAAAERAIDRTLYERLVPLAFPVWDTGQNLWGEINGYSCNIQDPFDSSPPSAAYTTVLNSLDPSHPAFVGPLNGDLTSNNWETYLMVHHSGSGSDYSFPSQAILTRMFSPVSLSDTPGDGGLAINAADVLPYSPSKYQIPGILGCGWS